MVQFETGKPFPLPLPKNEGASFSVEPFTLMLVYRYQKPTQEEIDEFTTGTFQMAVTELRKTLFIETQFGRLGWSDVPYSTQLSEKNRGYALDTFLVDISDNTLKAHRLVRLTPDFSRKFRNLLLDDMAKEFDPASYEQAVAEVYRDYSTRDLLKMSLIRMKADQ